MDDNLKVSAERINRSVGQRVIEAERAIAKRYALTLNEIRALLGGIYQKYETGGVLTFAEMAKFDRYNKFLQEVNHLLTENHKGLARVIYDILGWTYETAHNLTAWAIETVAMVKVGFSTAHPDAILAMLENPVSGLTLKQRLERHRQNIIWTIQQETTQGLVKGETYRQMADRIKPALENDTGKAIRIVRTEAHRVTEGSKQEAAAYANGHGVIMLKTWRNVADARVRHSPKANHRSGGPLDDKTLPVNEDFVGLTGRGPAPGNMHSAAEDIHCRCFLQYSVDEVQKTQYNDIAMLTFDKWQELRSK